MGKRRTIFISFFITFLLGLSACGKPVDSDTLTLNEMDAHETDNPIQSDLANPNEQSDAPVPLAVENENGLTWTAAPIWEYDWSRIDGSTATIPLTSALFDHFGGESGPPRHNATSAAYRNLIQGQADLIFVTYPSEDEFGMAKYAGVELEIIPIVKDALVFLVNAENPVNDIAIPQIREIYTGQTQNWGVLGGLDEDISAYQRSINSGSQTLFLKLAMDGQSPMQPPGELLVTEMNELVNVISSYDNSRGAIGYSVFYYVNNMYGNSRFKLLGINGVIPTRDSIASGDYPFEDYYYAVIRKDLPEDSDARKLIEWLLCDEGQTLAMGAGYIPLRPLGGVWPDDAIDPVYLGDVDFSSGTGGTVWKGWEYWQQHDLVKDYIPQDDAAVVEVWFDAYSFCMYIAEPDGRVLQAVLPYLVWQAMPGHQWQNHDTSHTVDAWESLLSIMSAAIP